METKKNIEILESLISTLEDGRLGYTEAAEKCEDTQLKDIFLSNARHRSLMVVRLQDEINKLGKSTDATDDLLGAAHRVWLDIKAAFTGSDSEAIIEACEAGEEYATNKFREALNEKELFSSLHAVISSQLREIERDLEKIKSYKKVIL